MKTLSLQDFTVRLQLMSCCFATKAAAVAEQFKIGIYCEEKIEELKILGATLDVLETYIIPSCPVDSIIITDPGTGYTPGVYNNVPLIGGSGSGAIATVTIDGGGTISSVVIETGGGGYIEGDLLHPDSAIVGLPTTGGVLTSSVGTCITDLDELNCLSYKEMLSMIDLFVEKCGLCFEPPGADYVLCEEEEPYDYFLDFPVP